MLLNMTDKTIHQWLDDAIHQAGRCQPDEGESAGAVLTDGATCIATGFTRRVESADPIRFAAMDCISNAGRRGDQASLTLCLSRTPNWLEAGTIVQFGIGHVVVASEDAGNTGTIEFLSAHDVSVQVVTR